MNLMRQKRHFLSTSVHCTIYNVYCTLYTIIQCILYTIIQCILYTVHYHTMYTVHCTLSYICILYTIIQCILYTVHYHTMYTVHCTLSYNVYCTLYTVQCAKAQLNAGILHFLSNVIPHACPLKILIVYKAYFVNSIYKNPPGRDNYCSELRQKIYQLLEKTEGEAAS